MTTLVAATAVVIAAFWLRMRHYRRQFNRAMEAMERGGVAQRAARTFWRLVLFVLVIAVLWTYVEAHSR